MSNPRCCGADSRWVENVADKGYFFCGECRNEVMDDPSEVMLDSSGEWPEWSVTSESLDLASSIAGISSTVMYWDLDPLTGKLYRRPLK